ncbi:LysR family transcriptional regulator, partial [Pseudomonas sp. BGM005]|nr:LysR family transcriptional regulator [Pseudomonas sp. BG5]
HVQLVLTDRTELSRGREFGVMSPQTWRLADLFAKHTFLLNGLGWGGMPEHAVRADIAAGRLVELAVEDISAGGLRLPMSAAYR